MKESSASSATAAARKAVARVALVGLPAADATVLRDTFRQFGIETSELAHEAVARFQREKYEGCVLVLDDKAETILHTARHSPSNRRMVIYGICSSAQEAMRYSRFGVNALLKQPVERQDALRVVRSTHLLVIHELRLYVRVPLAAHVQIKAHDDSLTGTTHEVSGGGMSIRSAGKLPQLGTAVRVQFDLPPGASISRVALDGTVCWIRERDSSFGVRFDVSDPGRVHVKQWIDEYLEIS